MGKYTVIDNPIIDQVIQSQMLRIVKEITSRIKPDSIVLRGSFGRGEGSVMVRNGSPHFLSDYEIDVTAISPFHRALFAKLTRELSDEFAVQTGIRWMRPDCLFRDRIGPFPIGKAKPTISLYEFRYGSRVLWGRDLFSEGPEVNPDEIDLMSGLTLLLNRMAESLFYMSLEDDYIDSEGFTYYWINKTILACAESILLVLNRYHYSYQERGQRFLQLPEEELIHFDGNINSMKEWVNKATEFKLQPSLELYSLSVNLTWSQILPLCESTLGFLVENILRSNWQGLSHFPQTYLDYCREYPHYDLGKLNSLIKLHEVYRALRGHIRPPIFNSANPSYQIVYSIVPLLFFSYGHSKRVKILQIVRDMMSQINPLEPPLPDMDQEWDYLRQELAHLWKVYCY